MIAYWSNPNEHRVSCSKQFTDSSFQPDLVSRMLIQKLDTTQLKAVLGAHIRGDRAQSLPPTTMPKEEEISSSDQE